MDEIIEILKQREGINLDLDIDFITDIKTKFYTNKYKIIEEKSICEDKIITRDIIVKDLEGNYIFRGLFDENNRLINTD